MVFIQNLSCHSIKSSILASVHFSVLQSSYFSLFLSLFTLNLIIMCFVSVPFANNFFELESHTVYPSHAILYYTLLFRFYILLFFPTYLLSLYSGSFLLCYGLLSLRSIFPVLTHVIASPRSGVFFFFLSSFALRTRHSLHLSIIVPSQI